MMKKLGTLLVAIMLSGSILLGAHAGLIDRPDAINGGETEISTNIETQTGGDAIVGSESTDLIGSKSFLYYYGNGCSYCAKVDAYLKGVGAYEVLDIVKKDTWDQSKPENNASMLKDAERLGISVEEIRVPFLIITENGKETYLTGARSIIEYFTPMLGEVPEKDGTMVLLILGFLVVIISAGIIFGGKKK